MTFAFFQDLKNFIFEGWNSTSAAGNFAVNVIFQLMLLYTISLHLYSLELLLLSSRVDRSMRICRYFSCLYGSLKAAEAISHQLVCNE